MLYLFYRLFRKDIFGEADEIELKFMNRFCYLIILKIILSAILYLRC
jgi:hypothetical protein